jgi:hypothetical protein
MAAGTIATEVVVAQIAGLDAEIARIDEQVANLQARREGVLMIKNALTPLVPQRITPGTGALQMDVGLGTPAVMVASAAFAANGERALPHPTSTGFRAAVRAVLRDNPKGLRPAEVVKELERRGELVLYTGKAKPSVRVHNELYSLHKSEAIARRGGRYSLHPDAHNAVK